MRPPLGRRTLARRSFVALGAASLIVPLFAANAFADSPGARSAIAGSRPAWASTAAVIGAPAASAKISFNVVLPLRNAAGAAALAAAVSNPASPRYGQYVTAAQFNAAYAPTSGQVAKVRSFLSGSGLDVTGVAAGNRWLDVSGTAQQIESAFSTKLRNYRYQGQTIREPSSTLSVPHSLAGLISGVVGVGDEGLLRRPQLLPPNPVGVVASHPAGVAPIVQAKTPIAVASTKRPLVKPNATTPSCSDYWDQHTATAPKAYGKTSFPTLNCGYVPVQLRTAYGVQPAVTGGNTGKGINVAIIDAYGTSTILSDANALAKSEGEPQFAAGQFNQHIMGAFDDQTECGAWDAEESLDVEAVHGIAPGATVDYIGATDCDAGLDDALNYVIQNQVAPIVSDSWGEVGEDGAADEVTTEHAIFLQGAAEGIGFYFSSGDAGDNVFINGLSQPEPDYPASDPEVTAVGGTSLAITSKNAYDFETAWGENEDDVNFAINGYSTQLPGNFYWGAGGGVSTRFDQPSYQVGVVPTSLATPQGSSTAMRVVPDIAAVADPLTGFVIEDGGTEYVYGGTSLACPVIAGVQALVSQDRIVPIGFANPELYSLGTTAFHDVKAPSSTLAMITPDGSQLFTMGEDSSLTATTGYDDTTGLGTPSGLNFLLGERLLDSAPVAGVTSTP